MNIGIFLPNWIGDVVMATPALRGVRRQFPNAQITGIMRPYVADVLAGTSWLDETLVYQPRPRKIRALWRLSRELKQRRFEKLLLLTNSLSTGLVGWLGGARERIGFAMHGRGCLLNKKLYPPKHGRQLLPRSAVDHYLEIAAAAGAESANRQVELALTPLEAAAAESVWREHRLDQASQVVVFNTGGAYGAAKNWPTEHFALLAKRLVSDHDAAVLVICGPAEKATAESIVRLADHERVVSVAHRTPSIRLSKGCLARADLVVSTDSGPRHIAAGLGVPTISLFGPTDPRWSDNYHPQAVNLQEPVPCGPCGQRVCPLGHHRCMLDLSVDRVYAAAQASLARDKWPAVA